MVVRVVVVEAITHSCPGSKVNMALVKCVQKDMFLLNTTIVDIEQQKKMLVSKGEGCGPELTGQISQLGFQFGRELTPLVTVCHANQGEMTHWLSKMLQNKIKIICSCMSLVTDFSCVQTQEQGPQLAGFLILWLKYCLNK